jgi:SAM-dependent methyltransferase
MNYYNRKYFTSHHHLDPHIANSIRLLCTTLGLKKIIDVGCGTGLLVNFLNRHGFQAIGIDKHYKSKNVLPGSAEKVNFPDSRFDLVTSISVIEHLTPHQANLFLCECFRILRPGGHIFLITPNFSSPFRLIRGKQWFAYSDPTHVTYYSPRDLGKLLTLHGFVNPRLRFPIDSSIEFDWHLPKFLRTKNKHITHFLTWIFISSPLSTCRDSFWIAAQKPL